MADTDRLRDLLHEMERARSPLQRLRLVALAWRTIRALSKKEREALALKVGMAEAGELVERLATKDGGVAPTELLQAIHAAETTDPDKLRQLVGGVRGVIRDPEGRRGLLNRAAEALDAAAAHAAAPTATAAAAAGPITPPKGVPRPQSAAAAPVSTTEPESPTRAASTPPPRATTPPPPTPRATRPPTRTIPPREATPPPTAPSERHLRPEPPALPSLAPEPPPAATRRLVDRLASLRRRAGLLRGEGIERLRQEMADLPAGWPRRRALDALLEAGLPLTTDVALELASDLERERDRAWCLGTLLRTRRLADRDLEAALELVSSPATRRRLRRLAASDEGDE